MCISLLFMLSYKFPQWNTRSPVDSIYLALTDLSEFQIFLLWAGWTLQLWGLFLTAVAIYFLHWHLQFLPQKTSRSSASLWSALSCFFPQENIKTAPTLYLSEYKYQAVPSFCTLVDEPQNFPVKSVLFCFQLQSHPHFFLLSKSGPLSGDRMWGKKRAGGPVYVNLRWQLSKLILAIVFSVFQCFSCHVEKKVM